MTKNKLIITFLINNFLYSMHEYSIENEKNINKSNMLILSDSRRSKLNDYFLNILPVHDLQKIISEYIGNWILDQTFIGHKGGVSSLTYCENDKYLVSSGHDFDIELWDTSNYNLIARFSPFNSVDCIAYCTNYKIASGDRDGNIKIWDIDINKPKLLHTLTGHKVNVWALDYSPDSRCLASASWDHTIKIWDTITYRLLHTLHGHISAVSCVKYSKDNKYLATASFDETIKIWDTTNYSLLNTIPLNSGALFSLAYSPDNKHLTLGGYNIKILDLKDYKLLFKLEHEDRVSCMAYSPDNKFFASGSWDKTIKIWDAITYKLLKIVNNDSKVFSLEFSNDSKYLIYGLVKEIKILQYIGID